MSEDDIIYWQDVLEAVENHYAEIPKCPFCYKGDIRVSELPRATRVECTRCGQYVEGRFKEEYYELRERAKEAERIEAAKASKPEPMK